MPIAVATISDQRSQFLNGLTQPERKTILSAATQRRFVANSVVTHQGQPADRLFLLTKGCARHFFVTAEGKKLLLKWLVPGNLFGGRTILSRRSSYLVGTEMVRDSSVFLWDRTTIRGLLEHFVKVEGTDADTEQKIQKFLQPLVGNAIDTPRLARAYINQVAHTLDKAPNFSTRIREGRP